jgi:tRNA dimethylallyltransferase
LTTVKNHIHKPLLVVVAGPTASGKTGVAIKLALHFQTEILSADSRQCYKELNIGVARPAKEELQTVPHHFIATHSIHEAVDAAVYESYGLEVLQRIYSKTNIAIVAGGTGLYIKALCEGLDYMPVIPQEIRERVRKTYNEAGLEAIQKKIALLDSEYAKSGEIKNPQRTMRALEVVMATGKSIFHFQQGQKEARPFRVCYLGMQVEKHKLHEQINQRVNLMMEAGLMEEVKALLPYRNLNPLQTVGYKEIFEYVDGKIPLNEAVEKIKIHTRQYAKRQMTWFRKQGGIQWIPPENLNKMISLIHQSQ